MLIEVKGYDAGKKSGIKFHIGVDTQGLPHTIMLIAANVSDRDGAIDITYLIAKYYHDYKKFLLMAVILEYSLLIP